MARRLAIITPLVLAIGIGAAIVFRKTTATMAGTVIDAESTRPVAKAKVVVTTWRRHLLSASQPQSYGTITDEYGRFRFEVAPGYWISHVDVAASTPDNKFGFHYNVSDDPITVESAKLTPEQRQIESYYYDTFRGNWDVKVIWEDELDAR